ncbi:MAG TPA: PAS domain-containing sensor histidine kinase [Bacteroidia bacterium]|jgi:two-component system CheB/CheR fusion protein
MKKESDPKILRSQYVPTAEFYSQLIDSLQDYSIFTMDNDLLINSWSSGSTNIFGYETDEITGKHFDVIFTEDDKKNGIPKQEIEIATAKGRAADNRWHVCKDGTQIYAYGLVFPLTGQDGERLGYVKILRDLTQKKNSEDAINKHMKEMEELIIHKDNILAILSHDLRSPLSGIIGTADYLRNNFERMDKSAIKEMLDLLHKTAKDELSMLDYLVEWARIKYASEAFSPTNITLAEHVQEVFHILNDAAGINAINLHHEIAENTKVFADKKMLLSILQNIVSNAIKHSQPGGKITVTAKTKEDKIIIEVKDTGIGMSEEIREKLFTPQLDSLSAERKEKKGAGIGLLLVKGFLETSGGEIWVESVEGAGSSFYFTLPLNKP